MSPEDTTILGGLEAEALENRKKALEVRAETLDASDQYEQTLKEQQEIIDRATEALLETQKEADQAEEKQSRETERGKLGDLQDRLKKSA